MKAMSGCKPMREGGFSLIELVIVIAITMSLLAIAGVYSKQWVDRYNAESQIRQMHVDLLQARAKAIEKNKQYFVVVVAGPPSNYQIYEDTNEDGGNAPDAGDTALWQTPKPLNYAVSTGATIIMDQRGIISPDSPRDGWIRDKARRNQVGICPQVIPELVHSLLGHAHRSIPEFIFNVVVNDYVRRLHQGNGNYRHQQ